MIETLVGIIGEILLLLLVIAFGMSIPVCLMFYCLFKDVKKENDTRSYDHN